MMKFYKTYENVIKEGIKTSTIRQNFNHKIGDIIPVYREEDSITCFGKIEILSVERIRFDEIDDTIAKTEGYLHPDLCKDVIQQIYLLEDSSLLYYIQFKYSPLEEKSNKEERKPKKVYKPFTRWFRNE